MSKILSILKVLFRNGETIIDIAKEIYEELNSNTPESRELDEMSKQILNPEEV